MDRPYIKTRKHNKESPRLEPEKEEGKEDPGLHVEAQ
jgi:hypothetical protein